MRQAMPLLIFCQFRYRFAVMNFPTIKRYLVCPKCGKAEYCGPLRVIERLREHGMLRRNVDPDQNLVVTLLDQAADSLDCTSCGHVGVTISEDDPMDELDWGNEKKPSKKCESCSQPIPGERLEIFPDTKLCTTCQSGEERGESTAQDEVEFCPKCGDILELKQSPTRGYRMVCRGCRR